MNSMATAGSEQETIGQRLRRLRSERGFSQRELSAPGVSYAYISRIEAGTRQPSVKALRKLAAKLGVSAEYLETGSDVRETEERELRLADAELALRLTGDAQAAERELREVVEEAASAGDTDAATRARIGLGLAALEQGRPGEAAELLERAIELGGITPTSRPDVFSALGRALSTAGRPEAAVELFERCLAEARDEPSGDPSVQVRFSTYLSFALTDSGDRTQAHEVLLEALGHAESLADPYTRIRLYWSLGRLAGHDGRSSAALGYFRKAIALLEACDDNVHLARANVACAYALILGGRAEEAGQYLELAEQLFGPSPAAADLASLRTEQAKHAIALGDAASAVAFAAESLELLGESDPAERGSAWHALAEGRALEGDVAGAGEAFGQAVAALEQAGRPQECAQAYRAWGRLLRAAGREEEALDALEKAADLAVEAAPAESHPRG
jgi:transcriptional regulator with XRE-family HTH domain